MRGPTRKATLIVAGLLVAGLVGLWLCRTPNPPAQEPAGQEPGPRSASPEGTTAIFRNTPPPDRDTAAGQSAPSSRETPAPLPGSRTRPSEAHGPKEIPLPDDWEKDPVLAASERRIAARMRELEERVSRETTAEKVYNLLYESTRLVGDDLMMVSSSDGMRYIATLHNDFRVQALVDLAENGTHAERRELYDLLVEMCRVYLEDLPLTGQKGKPRSPSASDPGGGKALPYLLTYVDDDATTLPLVAKMFLRLQEGGRMQAPPGLLEEGEWFGCREGLVFAYACDHFLNIYATRPDLQAKLSRGQRRVIKEYAKDRKNRPEDWDINRLDHKVMRFAVRFAELEDER